MTVEAFFNLFLIELRNNRNLWSYYKFHRDEKNFLFRKAYFCQRLQYIADNISYTNQSTWDCGCGYGTTALFLAMNNYKVYGTTLEFYFSEIEKRKQYWSQYGDATLFHCKYEDLFDGCYTNKFDTIILQDTLHHLEPIEESLAILKRSLKQAGKLLVVEENGANIIQNFKLVKRRGVKKTISWYDEKLQKTILSGNENIRPLATWKALLKKQGIETEGDSIRYIRLLPPFLIKNKSVQHFTGKEQQIARLFPCLKKYFYFGINFIAYKV